MHLERAVICLLKLTGHRTEEIALDDSHLNMLYFSARVQNQSCLLIDIQNVQNMKTLLRNFWFISNDLHFKDFENVFPKIFLI